MAGKGMSVLFSEMTPGPGFEADFNTWYDTEHIPLRMAYPGFVSGQRYHRHAEAGYLSVHEMNDLGALATDAYAKVKKQPSERSAWMLNNVTGFTRYLANETSLRINGAGGSALDTPVLYAVAFSVPTEATSEFDDWYEQDHIPTLMEDSRWRMVRRLRVAGGEPAAYTHLALHYLADVDVMASAAREKSHASPRRARIAANGWFKGSYTVFDRLGPRQMAKG